MGIKHQVPGKHKEGRLLSSWSGGGPERLPVFLLEHGREVGVRLAKAQNAAQVRQREQVRDSEKQGVTRAWGWTGLMRLRRLTVEALPRSLDLIWGSIRSHESF